MSTAGKVLAVLIMLMGVVCLILAGGVARLNQNANQKLEALAADLVKAQENLDSARREIVGLRDQTTLVQEKIDRDLSLLRVRQNDLERTRSQVVATLERVKYDLGTVSFEFESAKTALENRNAEFEAEEKATDELRKKVQVLKATTTEQMNRLKSLREQFQNSYHQSLQMLGKPK